MATLIRNLNSALYHNSLPPGASVSPDIKLGHHGLGTVVHPNVVIGRRVKIWHNVTLATRAGAKSPYRIIIEDDVKIGANSVVISPHRRDLRIGRGARIAAGAVVSRDVPAGYTVISARPQMIAPEATPGGAEAGETARADAGENGAAAASSLREAEHRP